MELVIKIPDNIYYNCKNRRGKGSVIEESIRNSIPLPEGHWIIDNKDKYRIWQCRCSNCKKDPQVFIGGTEDWWVTRLPAFCPNCGSKMTEDSEVSE